MRLEKIIVVYHTEWLKKLIERDLGPLNGTLKDQHELLELVLCQILYMVFGTTLTDIGKRYALNKSLETIHKLSPLSKNELMALVHDDFREINIGRSLLSVKNYRGICMFTFIPTP